MVTLVAPPGAADPSLAADDGVSTLADRAGSRAPRWVLIVILLLGLAVRLDGLDQSLLSFHPARQYRAAVVTRSLYLAETRPATDEARQNAEAQAARTGELEPPVMERLTAWAYHLTGGEALWVPRALGAGAWLLGAVALWSLLRRLGGAVAQVVGTSVFLLLPMGVVASTAFQPDALMVSTAVVGMALALRATEEPSAARLAVAVAASGASILIKPMVAPIVVAWWIGIAWRAERPAGRGRIAALVGATLVPAAVYYGWSYLTRDTLDGWVGGGFIPRLLLQRDHYTTWLTTVDAAVPLGLVALSLVALVVTDRAARRPVMAAWVGYVAFTVAVNYRAATHDYYHLVLVPLVALALGLGAQAGLARLRASAVSPSLRRMTVATCGVVGSVALLSGVGPWAGPSDPPGVAAHVAASERIGELTGHSPRVLAVTPSYGTDLAYHGGVVVLAEYPSVADVELERAQGIAPRTPAEIIAASGADWFAATNVAALRDLPELEAELDAHHELVGEGRGWRLWRLDR